MYKYSDRNERYDISLHDCRATKIVINNGILSFVFKEGFWVSERNRNNFNKKLSYTDESEVKFKTLYRNMESNIAIYVFTDTKEENKTIRAHKSKDRFGFGNEGFMHYLGWEEVRKSKDDKEL